MASMLSPVPMRNALTDAKSWLMNAYWVRWMTALLDRVNGTAEGLASVSATTQQAAVSATAFDVAPIAAGVYRLSYALNVTRAASSTSSLTFTAGWTFNGVAQSWSGAALTGNTTATSQSGSVLMNADASTSLTYAVAYASTGGTTMQYAYALTLEAL